MLRKVIFVLREYEGIDWQMRLRALEADLRRHNIDYDFKNIITNDSSDVKEDIRTEYVNPKQILFVSDLTVICRELTDKGYYVLPYRHAYNREEIFESNRYFYIAEQLEEMDYESLDMAYRRLAGLPWTIITTKRCVIRETTTDDVDAFYQIYKEAAITEYMEDLYSDRNEEIAYIQDYIRKVYHFYGYGMWTVVEKKNGQIIGRAGISWQEGFDLPELGFVIGVPWQRKGYAYEVCTAILRYAKEELGMERVQALVMKGNEKSAGLCEKLGFVCEDEVCLDGIMYLRYVFLFTTKPTCDKVASVHQMI